MRYFPPLGNRRLSRISSGVDVPDLAGNHRAGGGDGDPGLLSLPAGIAILFGAKIGTEAMLAKVRSAFESWDFSHL